MCGAVDAVEVVQQEWQEWQVPSQFWTLLRVVV